MTPRRVAGSRRANVGRHADASSFVFFWSVDAVDMVLSQSAVVVLQRDYPLVMDRHRLVCCLSVGTEGSKGQGRADACKNRKDTDVAVSVH